MAENFRTFPTTYSSSPITYHGPEKKSMSTGKMILGTVAALTAAGGFIADMNKTHMNNPEWPPHAKFHDAMSITLGTFLGTASLYFLMRKSFNQKQDTNLSAMLPSMFWAAQGISFVYPRAKGLEAEFPYLIPRVKGVWLDEKFVSLAMLALTGIGYTIECNHLDRKNTI